MNKYESIQKLYRPTRILVFRFSDIRYEKILTIVNKAEKKLEGENNCSLERVEEVLKEVYAEEAPQLVELLEEADMELIT